MRVLLVEDNELNMEIAQELLEDEGIQVTTAENGQLAVDAFTQSPAKTFDAILMDVMMPVMNGLDATRAIRASGRPDARTIPIIAMTANAYAEDITSSLEAGMDEHIAKPIDFDRLFAVLNQYRNRKESTQ
jgi:CheY-like chemotaxis protein